MLSSNAITQFKKDKATYLRLMAYLKPYRTRFILAILCTLPVAAMSGAIAYLVGTLADKVLQSKDYGLFALIPVGIIVLHSVEGLFLYYSRYLLAWVGTRISEDLRRSLFQKLLSLDIGDIKKQTPGALLSRYYSDPTRLQAAIVSSQQTFIVDVLTGLSLAAVLVARSWDLAVIAIGIISFIIIPIRIISKKIRKLDDDNQIAAAKLYDALYESIFGADLIALYDLTQRQTKKFDKALHDFFSNAMKIVKTNAVLKPVMQFISAIGIGAIFYWGGLKVSNNTMTPGELTSFIVALILLYRPVKSMGNTFSRIQRILAPAERVFEKLDMEPSIKILPNAQDIGEFESVTFDNVGFTYDAGEKHALKDVNLTINKGEIVAVVGRTGGGKSTLVNMIPRFLEPTHGEMRMNGLPYNQITGKSLRKQLAVVSQQTILFDGTIEDNIRLGRLDATEAELDHAIEISQSREILDTKLGGKLSSAGPGGNKLSGGQKQRVAIARAILKNANMIVFDEATSALDNETEHAIQAALHDLIKEKTVLIVAHRLSTIRMATRILVVDKGHIIEDGNHDALMELDGIYAKLYKLQFDYDAFTA